MQVNAAFSQVNFLPLLTSLQLLHNVFDRSSAHSGPGLIWWYCLTSVLYSSVWAGCIVRPLIPFPDQHGAFQNQISTGNQWPNDHYNCTTSHSNTFVLYHEDFILILYLMKGKNTPEVHLHFRQLNGRAQGWEVKPTQVRSLRPPLDFKIFTSCGICSWWQINGLPNAIQFLFWRQALNLI